MQTRDTIRRWPVAGVIACITLAAYAAFRHQPAPEPARVFSAAARPAAPTAAHVHDAIARTPLGS